METEASIACAIIAAVSILIAFLLFAELESCHSLESSERYVSVFEIIAGCITKLYYYLDHTGLSIRSSAHPGTCAAVLPGCS
jgi:hypothetical protein